MRFIFLNYAFKVIRWAEVQCKQRGIEINDANLRDVLGNLLFQIRFPLMTLEEFAAIAQFSNILSDSEKVDLFVYFISPIKPAIPFVNEKRCEVFGKEISINRFQRIESRWGYTGTTDKIKFTVDANIYLTAIGLYGSMQGENSYEVQIKVISLMLKYKLILFRLSISDQTE
jgi:BTB/POZ domain-containing protein 1/2